MFCRVDTNTREDFGKMVRGKYAARYAKDTNLVLLDEKVAKAFPTTKVTHKRAA